MLEANFRVRDRRKRKWFWTENLIVDKLMAKIGVHAHGGYSALIRWADNDDQTCAPSLSVIMEKTGLTRPTVVKALKRLQQGRLVAIQRRQAEDGSKIRNLSFILDTSQSPLLGDSQLNYLAPSKNERVTLGLVSEGLCVFLLVFFVVRLNWTLEKIGHTLAQILERLSIQATTGQGKKVG